VSHLPTGFLFADNHNGTATISGVPGLTDAGRYPVTITASVMYETTATQAFTLTIDHPPVFKSAAKDTVRTGVAFTFPITTKYGYPVPTITTASTRPAGVSLTDNGNGTATLGGTPGPTSGGVYVLTVIATNGIGPPVSQTFTLTVDQAPVITSAAGDTVTSGTAMTPFTVTDTGYPVPKLTATGLPLALKLVDNHNRTGTISGVPKVPAGTYTVTITASSTAGVTSQTFTLVVGP